MRELSVAAIVRLADPSAATDLVAALRAAGAEAKQRDERTILVTGGDEDLGTELLFFVRAWAQSRPVDVEVQAVDRRAQAR
jgi:hypothetical protein